MIYAPARPADWGFLSRATHTEPFARYGKSLFAVNICEFLPLPGIVDTHSVAVASSHHHLNA